LVLAGRFIANEKLKEKVNAPTNANTAKNITSH